jgi:hypothetical protein
MAKKNAAKKEARKKKNKRGKGRGLQADEVEPNTCQPI